MQAACGIQKYQIIAASLGEIHAVLGNLDRIALSFFEHGDIKLLADHL